MRLWLAVSLWSIVGLQACSRPTGTPNHLGDISAVPAADYLVRAFDRFLLVAFSEPRHGAGGTREFLTSLVRHPRFAGTVNDIVVEFGNARYQDIGRSLHRRRTDRARSTEADMGEHHGGDRCLDGPDVRRHAE